MKHGVQDHYRIEQASLQRGSSRARHVTRRSVKGNPSEGGGLVLTFSMNTLAQLLAPGGQGQRPSPQRPQLKQQLVSVCSLAPPVLSPGCTLCHGEYRRFRESSFLLLKSSSSVRPPLGGEGHRSHLREERGGGDRSHSAPWASLGDNQGTLRESVVSASFPPFSQSPHSVGLQGLSPASSLCLALHIGLSPQAQFSFLPHPIRFLCIRQTRPWGEVLMPSGLPSSPTGQPWHQKPKFEVLALYIPTRQAGTLVPKWQADP